MNRDEFLSKLELAYKEPNYYLKGGWGKWNGSKWGWDCICLIKGILWGWKNDKSKPRGGGAIYGFGNIPDYGETKFFNLCLNISEDFSNIEVGEMVWMKGHVGVYVGDGHVIEATAGWKQNKVVKSDISKDGTSSYKGVKRYKWLKHGFIPYVKYPKEEYWTKGQYELLYDKAIRGQHDLGNNILKVKQISESKRKNLTSQKPSAAAYYKKGTKINAKSIYVDNTGRKWAELVGAWVVVCNKDGKPQAKK